MEEEIKTERPTGGGVKKKTKEREREEYMKGSGRKRKEELGSETDKEQRGERRK